MDNSDLQGIYDIVGGTFGETPKVKNVNKLVEWAESMASTEEIINWLGWKPCPRSLVLGAIFMKAIQREIVRGDQPEMTEGN